MSKAWPQVARPKLPRGLQAALLQEAKEAELQQAQASTRVLGSLVILPTCAAAFAVQERAQLAGTFCKELASSWLLLLPRCTGCRPVLLRAPNKQ